MGVQKHNHVCLIYFLLHDSEITVSKFLKDRVYLSKCGVFFSIKIISEEIEHCLLISKEPKYVQ